MAGKTGSRRGKGPRAKNPNGVRGRRSALSPEVQAQIIESLEAGSENREAAEAAGIHEGTFYAWLRRAEEKKDEPYLSFANAVRKAEAFAEDNAMKCIANAMPTDWRAAAWFKEQRAKFRAGGSVRREQWRAGEAGHGKEPMTREGMVAAGQRITQRAIEIAERSTDPAVITAVLTAVTKAVEAFGPTGATPDGATAAPTTIHIHYPDPPQLGHPPQPPASADASTPPTRS